MNFDMFKRKVHTASGFLRVACPHGDPSEDQVREATKSANLPMMFEEDSFVIDSVRFAVFVSAYRPPMRAGMTIDLMLENAYVAWRRHQLETGVSTST